MNDFPDLRAGHSPLSVGEDSFWPSFTDIMMVVVMIFLISTAFLIIRNSGLTQQLTQTLESERKAAEQAKLRLEQNLTLEERILALENLLSIAQLDRVRTEEEKAKLKKRLGELTEQLSQTASAADALKQQLNDKTREIQDMISQLDQLESELSRARKEVDLKARALRSREVELAAARTSIEGLKSAQHQQAREIEQARSRQRISEESLARLRDEYASLETKYQKLVKPARTSKGKYVVSLRYHRNNGEHVIELKQPDDTQFSRYSIKRMHELLSSLKSEYDDKLYIRIIFPDNSDLTYKEAWNFTNEILNKYDYYYQDRKDEK
ncbi:MAG TPA: hypothetical protein ENK26_03315 [Gammaproteobacteria bacterium]|nr:hypothetical protein [Gammaproteobacteria bacterium]